MRIVAAPLCQRLATALDAGRRWGGATLMHKLGLRVLEIDGRRSCKRRNR
jgi:hypothetical protein